jgi:hypothetical protein
MADLSRKVLHIRLCERKSDEFVARDIDRLLAAFHGTRSAVPELPPARVIVDFVAARQKIAV